MPKTSPPIAAPKMRKESFCLDAPVDPVAVKNTVVIAVEIPGQPTAW
jgi:hypothetical protein